MAVSGIPTVHYIYCPPFYLSVYIYPVYSLLTLTAEIHFLLTVITQCIAFYSWENYCCVTLHPSAMTQHADGY